MRRRDDEAVSEVLGFVLTFALSAIFLMIALSSFYAARNNSEGVVAGVELKAIADRVAARIVEVGLIGQEFPNVVATFTISIPQSIGDQPYYVDAATSKVTATTLGGDISAEATTLKLDAVTGFVVTGRAHSSNEHVTISYALTSGNPTITISGV